MMHRPTAIMLGPDCVADIDVCCHVVQQVSLWYYTDTVSFWLSSSWLSHMWPCCWSLSSILLHLISKNQRKLSSLDAVEYAQTALCQCMLLCECSVGFIFFIFPNLKHLYPGQVHQLIFFIVVSVSQYMTERANGI